MTSKEKKYERIHLQLKQLLEKETSLISQMATINAILYHKFPDFFWVGFYFLNDNRLLVGPYQGPVACQELEKRKGVCWAAVEQNNEILVDDVEKFPGHIACDSRSKSEIVIPIQNNKGNIVAVLDIDSDKLGVLDNFDIAGLERIISLLNPKLLNNFAL